MSDLSKLQKRQYADWLKRKTKSNGELYSENTVGSYVSSLSTAPARLTGVELETTNISISYDEASDGRGREF